MVIECPGKRANSKYYFDEKDNYCYKRTAVRGKKWSLKCVDPECPVIAVVDCIGHMGTWKIAKKRVHNHDGDEFTPVFYNLLAKIKKELKGKRRKKHKIVLEELKR